jgi:hypothetical protein
VVLPIISAKIEIGRIALLHYVPLRILPYPENYPAQSEFGQATLNKILAAGKNSCRREFRIFATQIMIIIQYQISGVSTYSP